MRAWIACLLSCLTITAANPAKELFIDSDGNPVAYWLDGRQLKLAKSIDQGRTFGQPQTVNPLSVKLFNRPVSITGEGIVQPVIAADNSNRFHLLYVARDNNLTARLMYAVSENPASLEATAEARSLFQTQDEIVNQKINFLPWGTIISFQKQYLERKETYLMAALGGGRLFSQPKLISADREPLAYLFNNGKLGYFAWPGTAETALTWQEISLPPLATPTVVNIRTAGATLEVGFNAAVANPFIAKLEVSPNRRFPPEQTWSFDRLYREPTVQNGFPLPV